MWRVVALVVMSLGALLGRAPTAFAATLANGDSAIGTIAPVEDVASWTFTANPGDTLHVQVGRLTGTNFEPFLRLRDPSNAVVVSSSGGATAAVLFRAVTGGTYTAEVLDASVPANGTGTYRV